MSGKTIQTPDEILGERIEKVQKRREWRRFGIECFVLVAAIYLVFQYVIGIAFVGGDSMEPTLTDGELVIFYRLDQEYREDDLVLIHREGNLEYIKRIVAFGEDVVVLDESGTLTVNGETENRDFVLGRTFPVSEEMAYPYEVPENSYFVLGDNREASQDSRVFGAVKEEEITGRVFLHLGMTR